MEGFCAVAKRRRSSEINDLTDDLLVEILLRLPAKIVYRCKSVSKSWLSLISSSSFARSYILNCRLSDVPVNKMLLYKIKGNLPRVGQVYALPLVHEHLVDHSSLPLTFDFIPPLCPDNYDVDLYYLPMPKNFTGSRLLMAIHLVGNYGGLVLLKGMFVDPVHESSKPTPSGYPTYFYYYYLCNPITKHWVELPFIQTSNDRVGFTCYYLAEAQGEGENDTTTTTTSTTRIWADVSSYDKDNNDNYDPNKIEFTVISMHPHEKDGVFVIKLLSSADEVSGWNIFRVPFPPGWTSISFGRKILFMNGKFHWCGENSIVAYDPFCKPLECDDVIPFPPMDTFDFLSLEAFEGCLRLVTSFLAKTLVVWDLVDYGNKAWVKKVDINYNNNSSSDEHLLKFQSFVGGTGTGTARDKVYMLDISLVLDNSSTITLYDLKNESHQLVYDPSILDNAKKLLLVEPFISSPWPTPVPQLKTGNK